MSIDFWYLFITTTKAKIHPDKFTIPYMYFIDFLFPVFRALPGYVGGLRNE